MALFSWFSALVLVAAPPATITNPYAQSEIRPVQIDVRAGTVNGRQRPLVTREPTQEIEFSDLDRFIDPNPASPRDAQAADLPAGWVQVDDTVVPEAVAAGAYMVAPAQVSTADEGESLPVDNCAFPELTPAGVYEGDSRRGGEFPRRGTIYLNFLGGVLNTGGENSAENISNIALSGHMYPVFTGGEAKAIAVAQAVIQDFSAWAIRVVYNPRPRKILPYTMVMVGGHYTDTTSQPAGGVAPLDCEDFGQRNVCYSFTNGEPATSQANTVSQEVAHTYGLQHTYGADRIMSYEGGGDKIFGDNCQDTFTVAGQGGGCPGVNLCHCGERLQQNDHSTIGMIFAAPGPDNTPPTIEVTAPADGTHVAEDETIVINFDVWDDFGGYGWKLVIEDESGEVLVDQPDYDRALEFQVGGLPPGTYRIIGEIEDQADHVTVDEITVTVDGAAADTGITQDSDGLEATGASTGTSDADSDASDPSEGGFASTTNASEDSEDGATDASPAEATVEDGGCACRSGSTTTSPTPWFAVGLTLILRRRRSDSAAL